MLIYYWHIGLKFDIYDWEGRIKTFIPIEVFNFYPQYPRLLDIVLFDGYFNIEELCRYLS